MSVQILVQLKTPDPAARSALGSLRRRDPHAATLDGLERSTLIELELPASDADARAGLDRLLAETSVIANPNKERADASWGAEGTPLERPGILVGERGAVERPALAARIARMEPRFEGVRAYVGTLWVPIWPAPSAAWEAATAQLAGLGEGSVPGGLLVNPHANVARLVVGRIERRALVTLSAEGR